MYEVENLKREMIYCTCGTESILLEWWDGDEEKVAYLNMWERRRPGLSLFDRIRLAWRFLTNGYITADDIILNTDDMRRLGNLLLSLADTWAPLTNDGDLQMTHELRLLVDAIKNNAKEVQIDHLYNGVVALRVELGTKSFRGEGRTLSEAWEQILLSLIMASVLN